MERRRRRRNFLVFDYFSNWKILSSWRVFNLIVMYLNLFQIERHFHSINAAVKTNSTFSPCTDIQEFYELTLLDETKTVQQKTAETLQMASKWETANQQTGPAAVIIPTRFGDSIQQQSSSCVTAASTSSSFPMEVRTNNLRLNLFATGGSGWRVV